MIRPLAAPAMCLPDNWCILQFEFVNYAGIFMLPDLVTLNLFLSAVRRRSLSKAAEDCYIGLAAASRRIAILEDIYGVPLFYRSARGVRPTPAGLNLAHHARRILGQERLLRAELSDYHKGVKGHVRLHANTSAITQFLSEDLASFARAFPHIKIDLSESRSGQIIKTVRESRADVGIIIEGARTKDLSCFAYRADRLSALVPKNHAISETRTPFARIIQHDIVGLDSNTQIMRLLVNVAADMGKPLRLRVQLGSFEAVSQFVRAGMGIGILPERIAHDFAASAEAGLRCVHIEDDWAKRDMLVCVKAVDSLTSTARKLVAHLVGEQSLASARAVYN